MSILAGQQPGWSGVVAEMRQELHDRYDIRVDGSDPSRPPRYIAIARNLGVNPYVVVTGDLAELCAVLAPADAPQPPAATVAGA